MAKMTLTKESTLAEVAAYLAEWRTLAVKKYPEKRLAIGLFTDSKFIILDCDFSDITENNVSIDEKSFSSMHKEDNGEKVYKLRLSNLKNSKNGEKSFLLRCFRNTVLFECSLDEFFSRFEWFRNEYGNCANDVIFAQRAKAKRQKKAENTQMTLTVGHFAEYLLSGGNWSINAKAIQNSYDVKVNNTPYEVKTCLGKITYNGTIYNFGGSSIELAKDF